MHRQRKRDLNLKPNRVLDKRSSRGMIYENEELRLRTLAISDDVDRGHHDIKKLRKENDHLKREIWTLRDECEKLEDILKKVVISGNLDPSELPYPDMFLDYGSSGDPSLYGESRRGSQDTDVGAEDLMRTMFGEEEERRDDDTCSVIEVVPQQHPQPTTPATGDIPLTENPYSPKFCQELEPLEEECESRSQSLGTIIAPEFSLPNPDQVDLEGDDEGQGQNEGEKGDCDDTLEMTSEECPVIQITPASSTSPTLPVDTPTQNTTTPGSEVSEEGDRSGCGHTQEVQDIGCITQVPTTYQVTSQINITDPTTSSHTPAKKLSTLKLRNSSMKEKPHRHSMHNTTDHTHNYHGPSSFLERDHQVPLNMLDFGGSFGGFIVNRFCPSCYQSEPSLTTVNRRGGGGGEQFLRGRHLAFDPSYVHKIEGVKWSWWTGLESQLVVGVVEGGVVPKSQEIVDELESRFDPSLEQVKGIRILGDRVFLCLKDRASVTALLQHFNQPLLVNNTYTITFRDGSQGYCDMRLSNLGPEVCDEAVVSVLNQYGQVVGGVERRRYKGVEMWERGVRVHLVKPLISSHLVIGGYEVVVMKTGDTLEQGQQLIKPTTDNLNANHNQATPPPRPHTSSECETDATRTLKLHTPLNRCNSSNPRLGGAPPSPLPQKRPTSSSICAASIAPEEHPQRLFQKNPNLHKTSAAAKATTTTSTTAPNVIPPPKKPLTRLFKATPGTLVPPYPSAPGTPEDSPNLPTPSVGVTGLRAAFYRNLSTIDPRRGSTTSTTLLENNNLPPTSNPKEYLRRNSSQYFTSRLGQGMYRGDQHNQHQPLSQMNSNNSSSYDNHSSAKSMGGKRGEPLPWCGCWGNGCI